MAAIPGGVRVQGFIAPTSSNDTYPVTDPHYGLGGLRTVLNLGQRDQIPAERRMVGMLVFVQAANKYYKLLDDLVQWEEVDLSNILTNETDPTVPLHVKQIEAGTAPGQVVRWNGSKWIAALPAAETDPTVPTHVKQIPQPFFKKGDKIKSKRTQVVYQCTHIKKTGVRNYHFHFSAADGEIILHQERLSNILPLFTIL